MGGTWGKRAHSGLVEPTREGPKATRTPARQPTYPAMVEALGMPQSGGRSLYFCYTVRCLHYYAIAVLSLGGWDRLGDWSLGYTRGKAPNCEQPGLVVARIIESCSSLLGTS